MIPKDSYYDIKAISNSSLGYINPKEGGSPQKFKDFLDGNLKNDGAKHFINGTLVHMAKLEPEKFVIADMVKPSAELGNIADAFLIQGLEVNDENIVNTIRAFGWQNNWKDETIIKKFNEAKCPEYIKYMSDIRNSGKIAMDKATGKTVESCVSSLTLNVTAEYLLNTIDEQERYESHNELEVQWKATISGIELKFKSKLDRLILDHETKTYCIVDVKTTGKAVGSFQNSFVEFGYPRQIKFYQTAAKHYLAQNGLKDYTFDQAFIVCVETNGYFASQVFDVSPYMEDPEVRNEVMSLIKRVAFHYNESNWIEPMESIEGQGTITLSP